MKIITAVELSERSAKIVQRIRQALYERDYPGVDLYLRDYFKYGQTISVCITDNVVTLDDVTIQLEDDQIKPVCKIVHEIWEDVYEKKNLEFRG